MKLLFAAALTCAIIFASVTAPISAMTLGTHFMAGSGLASLLAENDFQGFAVGFVSHALLDAIPHNDKTPAIHAATALAAGIYIYAILNSKQVDRSIAITGGLAGMLPDAEHRLKRIGVLGQSYYPSHNGSIRQPWTEPATAFWIELGLSAASFKLSF